MSDDNRDTQQAPGLGQVGSRIDSIDRSIQELVAGRARRAHQGGLAKGPLAAGVGLVLREPRGAPR